MDELRAGLELATDEELQAMTTILFRRRFNPLDYALGPDPIDVQSQNRQGWLDELEQRFRFLAADGFTVLRQQTHQIQYRDVLIQVCRYLKIPYSQDLSAIDLESEIFLHILERAWAKLPPAQRTALTRQVQQSLSHALPTHSLPESIRRDPIRLLLEGGGAIAISSVLRPWLLQHIARQFAAHAASYYASKQALMHGGGAIAAQIQSRFAMGVARRGMALSAARYGVVRGVLGFVGPALWLWFCADLGWRAIATNYGRVIPIVFTLAQIRLLRSPYPEMA